MTTAAITPASTGAASPTGPTESIDIQDSLVGDGPDVLSQPESQPTPATGSEVTAPTTETTDAALTTDATTVADGAQPLDRTDAEIADDWLPTEQEKEFPFETIAKFAETRYKVPIEKLRNDPALQLIIKDKLNSDIEIRNHRSAAAGPTHDATTVVEEDDQPVTLTPEQQVQKYEEFVSAIVTQVFDQNRVTALGRNLYSAFGVDLTTNPEDPDTKAAIANAPRVGKTLAVSLVDGVATALPHLLLAPNPVSGQPLMIAAMEHFMPGIYGMWERAMYQTQWDKVRSSKGKDGQLAFKNLPEFGTPEFQKALDRAVAQVPDFDAMVYRDTQGQVLPLPQQAELKYRLLAQIANGQQPKTTPATAAAAFTAGKKAESDRAIRRDAGKAMGAGGGAPVQLDSTDQPDPLDAAIAQSNSNVDWVPTTTK